jgi:hypothetical protein
MSEARDILFVTGSNCGFFNSMLVALADRGQFHQAARAVTK